MGEGRTGERVDAGRSAAVVGAAGLPTGSANTYGDVMAPQTPADEPLADELDSYLGLSAQAAERRAGERGWSTVRTLAPDAIITMEFVVGRLNLTVRDGTVVRCWKG